MLRRILLIACVALFALCAGGWWVGHRKTVGVSTDVGRIGVVFHRGGCMVFHHRGTAAVQEGRLVVKTHGLVHGDAWDWMYFDGRVAGFGYVKDSSVFAVRFPLVVPAAAAVLLGGWLRWRGRRAAKGKGFAVQACSVAQGPR